LEREETREMTERRHERAPGQEKRHRAEVAAPRLRLAARPS
jgi:hypothetical protein